MYFPIGSTALRVAALLAAGFGGTTFGQAQTAPSPAEITSIAADAAPYGLPILTNYASTNASFIDKGSGQYKAGFNQLFNESRVFTPEDTAVVTPNSDTPYSFIGLDLRAEPMVLCVPEIEASRYYSIQFVSMYTFSFAYVGSRATGNGAGCFAVTGPDLTGEMPKGIEKVFVSETDFTLAIYRTQYFKCGGYGECESDSGQVFRSSAVAIPGAARPRPRL